VEQFFKFSGILADIFLGIALVLAIIKYKRFTKNEKWYIYYSIFVFCIEIIMFFKIEGSTKFLYPVYIAGEFFLLSGIFIKKLKLHKYYFIATAILSLLFLTIGKILPQYENDYSKAVSNLIIIVLIAYSLIQEIKISSGKNNFLLLDGMLFLYYTVSIFIFMFQQQLIEFHLDSFYIFWIINNSLLVFLYFTILYTFLKLKK